MLEELVVVVDLFEELVVVENLLEVLVVVGDLLEVIVADEELDETAMPGSFDMALDEAGTALSSDTLETSPSAVLILGVFITLGSKTSVNTNAKQAAPAEDAITIIFLVFLRLFSSSSDAGPKVSTLCSACRSEVSGALRTEIVPSGLLTSAALFSNLTVGLSETAVTSRREVASFGSPASAAVFSDLLSCRSEIAETLQTESAAFGVLAAAVWQVPFATLIRACFISVAEEKRILGS